MNTPEIAFDDLLRFLNQNGGPSREWYAGVATDCRERLFTGHLVIEDSELWTFDEVLTPEQAREVARKLHALGCDGAMAAADPGGAGVYLYRKSGSTRP